MEALRPSLLLLLPHTLEHRLARKPALEIGAGQTLISTLIRPEHVRPGPDRPPPVVFLLGCETGSIALPFEGFVAQFRRQGAAIILSTVATIVGRHAAPIARMLVRAIARWPDRADATFGELMREARREALAGGLPVALCLVAYGDAGWILHRNEPEAPGADP